ncbi:glycine receptor subunit alpha-2-like [Babylonia areolata]|uniref:glycine receptor subunit alpha-2-like n=1 Tax=Babylonia areolata TaxID=304850 RepID=UPI003FD421AC
MNSPGAFLFVCLIVASLASVDAQLNTTAAHRQLLDRLQYPGYDSGVRPYPDGQAVTVEVDVVFVSVGPVNEMDMTWGASFYLRQEWTDERLVLEVGNGNKVKLDRGHVSKLWLPDLFFPNSKEGRKHVLTVPNHLIYVNTSTGRVLYSQRITVVLNCEMDLIKFPHDNQTCYLKMESYSFTTADLSMRWSSSRSATSLLPTANMPDFSIQGFTTMDCTATYAIGTFPCLQATLRMSRQIGFYIFQTYLPSVLTVILSWASFWIDHEAVPARISVGLLTVLTITTQLSGSRAQLPRVPYIKAIDVWMSANLVFVFAAYMEYAAVTVLSRKYKKNLSRSKFAEQQNDKRVCACTCLPTKQVSNPPPSPSFHPVSDSSENATFNAITFEENVVTENTSISAEPTVPDSPAGEASRQTKATRAPSRSQLDSKDTGRRVDKMSRGFFPLAYAIFNIVYWLYYLVVT